MNSLTNNPVGEEKPGRSVFELQKSVEAVIIIGVELSDVTGHSRHFSAHPPKRIYSVDCVATEDVYCTIVIWPCSYGILIKCRRALQDGPSLFNEPLGFHHDWYETPVEAHHGKTIVLFRCQRHISRLFSHNAWWLLDKYIQLALQTMDHKIKQMVGWHYYIDSVYVYLTNHFLVVFVCLLNLEFLSSSLQTLLIQIAYSGDLHVIKLRQRRIMHGIRKTPCADHGDIHLFHYVPP